MKAWADLYLTRDRKRVVERDDPARAFTYLRKGKEIPVADVKRYGIEGPTAKAEKPPEVVSKPEVVPIEKLEALAAEAPEPGPAPQLMHFGSADPGPASPDEAPRRRKKAEGE